MWRRCCARCCAAIDGADVLDGVVANAENEGGIPADEDEEPTDLLELSTRWSMEITRDVAVDESAAISAVVSANSDTVDEADKSLVRLDVGLVDEGSCTPSPPSISVRLPSIFSGRTCVSSVSESGLEGVKGELLI